MWVEKYECKRKKGIKRTEGKMNDKTKKRISFTRFDGLFLIFLSIQFSIHSENGSNYNQKHHKKYTNMCI